tara:strand:- start:704 stop:1360 length:657 start_codon:yes stop_codon:yes gene_type:complete
VNIYIGYEEAHPEMYEVCKASIERFSKLHVIKPLIKSKLIEQGVYSRPFQGEATDFSFTRFLVPYLNNFQGWALFVDGDFLFRADPQDMTECVDEEEHDVYVVKHPELITKQGIKMDGRINRPYPCKYWSSLMYINCDEQSLSPETVNTANAGYLHEFNWAGSIGSLPATWNNMIGYYDIYQPCAVHFTDGGPWLKGFEDQPYADEWRAVRNEAQRPI